MKSTVVYVLLTVFSACSSLMAQEDGLSIYMDESYEPIGEITPKHTLNFVASLPKTLVNKPYSRILKDVVDLTLAYQYFLPNSLTAGVGVHYTNFGINEFRVPEPITGTVQVVGGFVKLGHEKFYLTRFGIDFSVKLGYSHYIFNTDLNTKKNGKPTEYDGGFIAPTIGFILTSTERSSYRLTFSYVVQALKFNPKQLGTDMTGSWSSDDLTKNSQLLTVGLGYTYYLGKR